MNVYSPSSAYYREFTVHSPITGAAVDADSPPTAAAALYGSGSGAFSLTVTNLATGRYKVTGTVPATYAAADHCIITVSATVAGIAVLLTLDDFRVVPANVYDSLVAGSDYLQADAAQVSGDGTAADNLEAMLDGTGGQLKLKSLYGGAYGLQLDTEGGTLGAIAVTGDSATFLLYTEAEVINWQDGTFTIHAFPADETVLCASVASSVRSALGVPSVVYVQTMLSQITVTTSPAMATADAFTGALLLITSGTDAGYWAQVTDDAVDSGHHILTLDRDLPGNALLNDTAVLFPSSPTASAITDAMCDELLSGHDISGSVGKTLADLPDSAGLRTALGMAAADLDTQLDAILTAASDDSGAGSKEVLLTVNTTGGSPISGAAVWITTDLAGTNIVAGYKNSDTFGQVTFWLDPGTYYVWRSSPNYTLSNPQTITVTA